MKFIINNYGKRSTVVFVHGYTKLLNDFNTTDKNKKIRIEERVRDKANTILVGLDLNDYKKSIHKVGNRIYDKIAEVGAKNIVLVCHSYGAFIAYYLAERDPHIFSRLLLIEPTIKSDEYKTELVAKKEVDKIAIDKLKNFDALPIGLEIRPKVIVRIHIDYKCSGNKIEYLYKLVNKNTKSRLIVHVKKGHMIHYKIPDTILDSIIEMINIEK